MTSTSSEVTYQDVQGRIDQFMTRFQDRNAFEPFRNKEVARNQSCLHDQDVFSSCFRSIVLPFWENLGRARRARNGFR